MKPEQWDGVFAMLTSGYPAWQATEETSLAWFKELHGFDVDVVLEAIKQTGMELDSQYPPSIYQVVKRAQAIEYPDDSVGEIWDKIRKKLQRGDYRVDEFSEPAQRAIRAIGGMSDLGMTHVDEMKWKKKEFAEAYGEYREQQLANPEGFDQKRLGAPDSIKALVQGVLK